MTSVFLNSGSGDLFFMDHESGNWIHLPVVGIERIEWPGQQTFICKYCGSIVPDDSLSCPGCGGRNMIREGSLGKAQVVFVFFPPDLTMFNPPRDIMATFACYGARNDPDNWEFRIGFHVLRVCHRWIDNLVAVGPDGVSRLPIYVETECEVVMEARNRSVNT